MTKNPWTDPDPQPGDFDQALDEARPEDIERHDGNPDATLSILVSIEGDDVGRLERIAASRGQRPSEVVADLLRSAS